jgi:hypothetical protein
VFKALRLLESRLKGPFLKIEKYTSYEVNRFPGSEGGIHVNLTSPFALTSRQRTSGGFNCAESLETQKIIIIKIFFKIKGMKP